MQRISSPLSRIKQHYEIVVIGSGYGGGVAASRMARAGRRVCLLERGREIVPGEYPDTLATAAAELQAHTPEGHLGSHTALFDFHIDTRQNVVVGCGLGGTSLINANVALEPDPGVFADPRWPAGVRAHRDTLLREGYEHARTMLKPASYPVDAPMLKKLEANKKSAAQLGQSHEFYRPPLNVNFEKLPNDRNHVGVEQLPCNGCGDCVSGCNYRAKNTTLMNYLPDAWNHGAEIFCEAAVRHLEKDGDGWIVHFQAVDSGREKFSAPPLFVRADIVIVAAGTLGSTEILLRSQKNGLPLSPQLGRHMSGNGDFIGFGYNSDTEINGVGFGARPVDSTAPVGPCITSIIDMRDQADARRHMVIEEGTIPGAIGRILGPVFAAAAALTGECEEGTAATRRRAREWQSFVRGPHCGADHNTQTYLGMRHDSSGGRMLLDGNDSLRIDWSDAGESDDGEVCDDRLRRAAAALGGIYVPNPLWSAWFRHSGITVHPLGGCIMGEDAARGVVNHKGQVFSGASGSEVHANLYVADGAVVPTSLAVNPLLTITALSERAMALLAHDRGWRIDYTLPSAPRKQPEPVTLGIEFTETMRGFFSTAFTQRPDADFARYRRACASGKADASPLEFTLTVTAADMQRLLDDPSHPAAVVGTVTAPRLSAQPLMASEGTFKLFERYCAQVGVRRMNYNMRLDAEDGSVYFLSGFKSLPDDHGLLDIWSDASTLYVTVFKGGDASGGVVGSGVMRIEPADFARQMSTLKVLNATGTGERLAAAARFGRYFAGVLWDSYGGVCAGDHFFHPDAPPRRRRPLNTDAPTLHVFKTPDGVELRLARYRGGDKGPVMLLHGLGAASTTFSTDTIPTNLLEYLYNHGYDVWLLDYRVSILLPSSRQPSTADDVAAYDLPAAIDVIRGVTRAPDVQCVAHCYGATTLFMAVLAGMPGVRSIVCSQVAIDKVVPTATALKTGLRIPTLLDRLGVHSLTAYTDADADWRNKLFDRFLSVYVRATAHRHCDNPVCHRITFMYEPLYRHDTLNDTLHANLHELFGIANMRTFEHLALMCRAGKLLSCEGDDIYMPHEQRLQLPICFISGADNACYLPASTERTYNRLCERFDPALYSRHVIPGYGHIDCMFGKNAVEDVYPVVLRHLEKTAQNFSEEGR